MSFRSKVTLAGFIALAAACNTEAGTPLGPDSGAEPALNASMGGSRSQSADLLRISDLSTGGSGTLTRLPSGITTHITVDPGVIPEGDVITLWGAIFNDPSKCTHPIPDVSVCDFPDIEAANGNLVWLGSGIASGGSTRYTGHVMVGDASGDILGLFGLSSGPGLLDPAGAVVHVVIRTHGQPIPGALQSQRKTFLGPNCTVEAEPEEPCADLLFAAFELVP